MRESSSREACEGLGQPVASESSQALPGPVGESHTTRYDFNDLPSRDFLIAEYALGCFLNSGDTAIDATCGRGKDTLTLAEMTGASGMVVAVDIQPSAIKQSKDYVEKNLSPEKKPTMLWVNESHERFPNDIPAESVSAIVYNLGYLPGDDSDRTIVTKSESTIRSLQAGLELLRRGGLITVTAYIKQEGGPEEEAAVLDMASNLDPKLWTVNYVQWINRELAPSIIAIEKKI